MRSCPSLRTSSLQAGPGALPGLRDARASRPEFSKCAPRTGRVAPAGEFAPSTAFEAHAARGVFSDPGRIPVEGESGGEVHRRRDLPALGIPPLVERDVGGLPQETPDAPYPGTFSTAPSRISSDPKRDRSLPGPSTPSKRAPGGPNGQGAPPRDPVRGLRRSAPPPGPGWRRPSRLGAPRGRPTGAARPASGGRDPVPARPQNTGSRRA
jgi:translation initiation factor IF-2